MLAWLSDWLKGIIAIVLMASLIDLILPGKAMQRYVRLVVGLLILVTLLSPILKLLNGDIETILQEGVRNWGDSAQSGLPDMPGLEEITEQGEQLRNQQLEQARGLAIEQLSAAMKQEIETKTGAAVARLDIELKDKAEISKASIQSITVLLEQVDRTSVPSPPAEGGANASTPVQPVTIDAGTPIVIAPLPVSGQEAAGTWVDAERPIRDKLASLLQQGWGIDPRIVQVKKPSELR
jgi:stage III sporulation protein AF